MNNDEKKQEKNPELVADDAMQVIPKVSKVVIDEKTGTVTLTIWKEEKKEK
jgi:hypothetical protein